MLSIRSESPTRPFGLLVVYGHLAQLLEVRAIREREGFNIELRPIAELGQRDNGPIAALQRGHGPVEQYLVEQGPRLAVLASF